MENEKKQFKNHNLVKKNGQIYVVLKRKKCVKKHKLRKKLKNTLYG